MTVEQISIEIDTVYRLIEEEFKRNSTSPSIAVFIMESVSSRIKEGVLASTSLKILELTKERNELIKPVEVRKSGSVEDLINSFNNGGFKNGEGIHSKKE